MKRIQLTTLAATLLTLCCHVGSATEAASTDELPKLAFEKYQLANGLEVILSEDHRLPLVAVNLWYHVGPVNERPGRTGFAHLFEHMMFQGSKHVGDDQHFKLLESAGASGINGTTGFDRTNYFETLPSNQLELALWIESDRMGFLLDKLDQAKLSNQIDVVRNERRQSVENAPYGLVEETVFHELFPKTHPYHASVMGSHADIEAARLNDVRAFFQEYYTPNNASLAIVGDIDKAHAKALVEKYFGPLAAGKPAARPQVLTPPITSERRVVVTDKVELPRVYMSWLTAPIYQPGDADADLLASLLGGGKSSRLYKSLVYEKQIAQDVEASQFSLSLGSVFTIQATARPGVTLATLEQAIDAELAKLRAEGPTPAELQRARNGVEAGIIRGLETLGGFGGVADRLNQYNHFLGNPDYLQSDIERYRKASVESVRAVAQQLTAEHRLVVEGVPGAKVIDDVPRHPVAAAKGPAAPMASDAADWRRLQPSPAAASPLKLAVPQRFNLENGLNVLLLEQHQLPVLSASVVILRGSESNPANRPGLASFTAAMLDEGTTRRSAPQLADDAAQIGAELHSGSTSDDTSVSIGVLRKDAGAAFDLLADVVQRPAFQPAEIERQRRQRLTALQQQGDNASFLASRVLSRALYGTAHPYGFTEIGTADSLQAIAREDLQKFWQAGYTPGNAALVVSGDITAADLRRLAEQYFGQWSGVTERRPLPATPATAARRILVVDKPGAPQTAVRVGQIGVARSSPDYVALEVMNTTLGGLFSSRINMNLREQHGYAYGAGSGFAYRRGPGPFSVRSNVRTDVTAPAVKEIFRELNRMRTSPVSADELTTARDFFARSLPGEFETTAQSVGAIADIFVYSLPLDYYSTLPASIDRVSIADVSRVAAQYLHPEKMTVVAVGDRARILPALSALKLGRVDLCDFEGKVLPPKSPEKPPKP